MFVALLAFSVAKEYVWNSGQAKVVYDDATGIVTISGTGAMAAYNSEEQRPWNDKCEVFCEAVVEEGVTSLAGYCFGHCKKLTSVNIIADIPSIPEGAFTSCPELTQISLPGSIQSIDDFAFSACTSINNFIIPGGVTTVGVRAFADCTALESVAIPASVAEIKRAAFSGCGALANVFYCGTGFTCQKDDVYDSFPSSLTKIHIVNTYPGNSICGVQVEKDLTPECEQFDVDSWWNEFPKEPEIAVPTASPPLELDYFDGTPWGFVATVILIMVALAIVTAKNLYSNVQRQMKEGNSDDLLADLDEA